MRPFLMINLQAHT